MAGLNAYPTLSNSLSARMFYRHARCGGFFSVGISWGSITTGTGGPLIALQGEPMVMAQCNKCEEYLWLTGSYLEALVEIDYDKTRHVVISRIADGSKNEQEDED